MDFVRQNPMLVKVMDKSEFGGVSPLTIRDSMC